MQNPRSRAWARACKRHPKNAFRKNNNQDFCCCFAPLGFCGLSKWLSVILGDCDSSWFVVIPCDSSRFLVIPRDSSWSLSWFLVIPRDSSWFLVIPRDSSWFLVIPRDSSWSLVMIPRDSLRFLVIPRDSSRFLGISLIFLCFSFDSNYFKGAQKFHAKIPTSAWGRAAAVGARAWGRAPEGPGAPPGARFALEF